MGLAVEESNGTWFGCLLDSKDRLVSAAFGNNSKTVRSHLTDYSKHGDVQPLSGNHQAVSEMIRLFNGKDPREKLDLNMDRVSKFQQRVYDLLNQIPLGRVTTYGLLSKRLSSSPRAVGGAVGSNPWPLFVPCQRVVNFDLTVGNYGMCGSLTSNGTNVKRELLLRENVPIVSERIVAKALWDPARIGR